MPSLIFGLRLWAILRSVGNNGVQRVKQRGEFHNVAA